MQNTFTIYALVIALFWVRTASGQGAKYRGADACEVYSVVIASEWPIRVGKAKKLVIEIETTDYRGFGGDKRICLVPSRGEEAIYKPLIDAYGQVNKKTWLLQRKFASSIPYELVSQASVKEIFAKKGTDG